jgi:hypothetical protein
VREITDRGSAAPEPDDIVRSVASTAWTCVCGRRVPPFIFTCRCGQKRPADAGGVAGASTAPRPNRAPAAPRPPTPPRTAAVAPPRPVPPSPPRPVPPSPPVASAPAPATVLRKPTTLRPPSSRAVPAIPTLPPTPLPPRTLAPPPLVRESMGEPRELGFRLQPRRRPLRRLQDLPSWAQKVLIGVAVVAFYFAARALNRFRVSFTSRDVAIERLIPLMGLEAARQEAGRQHGACFDKAYRTGWVKWQDYSFDATTHADCVLRSVMAGVARRDREQARAGRAAEAARRPPAPARTPPPPPRTPRPSLSRVALGNVQVSRWSRAPQVSGNLRFVAIGSADALASIAMCSYAVTCEGQAQAPEQRALAPCPLRVQGAKGEGELDFALLTPAPAEGACSVHLSLTDGTRPRSSMVVVPLP